jgi:hypothetical protein
MLQNIRRIRNIGLWTRLINPTSKGKGFISINRVSLMSHLGNANVYSTNKI